MKRVAMAGQWIRRLACLCVGLSALSAQAGWIAAQSDHFAVFSDAGEAQVRDYVGQLEAFREAALLMLGADTAGVRAQSRFDIVLLRRPQDISLVRPEFSEKNTGGVYFQCAEGALAYATLRPKWRDGSDPGLEVLLHEYAHRLMFQYARISYPAWYVEGFAEYMAGAQVGDGRASIGEPPAGRVQTLARPWTPYEELLNSRGLKRGSVTDDTDQLGRFYAQSWLLAHYMLSDSGRTQKFNAYFQRLAAGEDAVAAFETATGIALTGLPRLLKRHLEDMPFVRVPVHPMPASAVKVEALPEEAGDVLMSASLLKTCPPKPQGQAILETLRTRKKEHTGGTAFAVALARAELLFGDAQAALDGLQPVVQADDSSFEAHHLLARALKRSAEALDGEARREKLGQSRAEFFKAYRLKKNDAPNLYHMAQTLMLDGDDANRLNAARGARAMEPTVGDYAAYEAWLDIDAGDRERAAAALAPLASNTHDPQGAARMRRAIEAIRAGKSRPEVTRLMKGQDETP